MSKITNKACCLYCNKPLRKHTRLLTPLTVEQVPKILKPLILRVSDGLSGDKNVSVWDGAYGSYGDNRFCGLRCGYRWALKQTRRPLCLANEPAVDDAILAFGEIERDNRRVINERSNTHNRVMREAAGGDPHGHHAPIRELDG